MAKYLIEMDDGTTYKVAAPEGASEAQITAMAQKMHADRLSTSNVNPTDGMTGFEKFAAGYGKALPDMAVGIGQRLGLVDQKTVDDRAARDAPLMKTGAGQAGYITGTVAPMLATAAVPKANTLVGAAGVGALTGLIQPTTSDESVLKNVAVGGVAGPLGVMAGRGLAASYQGAKALIEPFTEAGRNRIAGRTLQRFADDVSKINSATSAPTVTGARPTLAEQTGDVGLARLEDSLRAADPKIGKDIEARLLENNAARVNSLNALGGDTSKRAAAEAARDSATKDLYTQATKANYTIDSELADLLNRPAVKTAMERAKTLAANKGRPTTFSVEPGNPYSGLGVPNNNSKQITGQTLQDLKMAMDEMLSDPTSGFAGKSGDAVRELRGKLINWMESRNSAYRDARTTYRDMSKPINGMDVGDYLATKATSNTSNAAGDRRMQANALLNALRDEAGLVQKGTGRKELNALSQVFEPDQINLINAIAKETDRSAAMASAGAGPGSATARRMASQNILQQLIGPTGMPKSWADSVVANTVLGKPFNLVYGGVAEPKIQEALARAVLDPDNARAVLAEAQKANIQLPPGTMKQLLAAAGRTSVPTTSLVARER